MMTASNEFRGTLIPSWYDTVVAIVALDLLRFEAQLSDTPTSPNTVTNIIELILRADDSGQLAYLEDTQVYFSV